MVLKILQRKMMKESRTGERVVVRLDSEKGPWVEVLTFEDGDTLEEGLNSNGHYVLYEMGAKCERPGYTRYLFGSASNSDVVQKVIDQIEN